MSGRFTAPKSLFKEEDSKNFAQKFDAAGDATITRIYNSRDEWTICWNGTTSQEQDKLLGK